MNRRNEIWQRIAIIQTTWEILKMHMSPGRTGTTRTRLKTLMTETRPRKMHPERTHPKTRQRTATITATRQTTTRGLSAGTRAGISGGIPAFSLTNPFFDHKIPSLTVHKRKKWRIP